ncbi:MAG: hypothetical protein LUD79_06415 [Oscillospiraceae bacterium]|nr:hypothetical protein [Oscillospiraceae bacterium]
MSEFDEKLNQILSSPGTMEQIMSIANSLGAGNAAPQQENEASSASSPPSGAGDDGASPLSGLDPSLIETGMTLLREYNREDDQKTQLLQALRPFLREERSAGLDRAMQLTKISRVIRLAMNLFRKGDAGDV